MEAPKLRLFNRESLIEKFRNGSRPEEGDFKALIDSTINKLDDGLSNSFTEGLQLSPSQKNSHKLISFYEDLTQPKSDWYFGLDTKDNEISLQVQSGKAQDPLCTFDPSQRVGILTKDPKYSLDVAGTIGMQSRIGTFSQGELPADGNWHTILEDLSGVQAFEIMVYAYADKGEGKYALMHAFLLNAYAGKKGKVKRTQNYFGWKWWYRLRIKWEGTPFSYNLKLKTAADYGQNGTVTYTLCKLL